MIFYDIFIAFEIRLQIIVQCIAREVTKETLLSII